MSLGQELAPHLPFLRRYARALTGSQMHGDAFVRAALETIVAKPDEFPREVDPRLGLYRTFHAIWSTANVEEGEEPSMSIGGAEGIAQARLSRITPLSRQASSCGLDLSAWRCSPLIVKIASWPGFIRST